MIFSCENIKVSVVGVSRDPPIKHHHGSLLRVVNSPDALSYQQLTHLVINKNQDGPCYCWNEEVRDCNGSCGDTLVHEGHVDKEETKAEFKEEGQIRIDIVQTML